MRNYAYRSHPNLAGLLGLSRCTAVRSRSGSRSLRGRQDSRHPPDQYRAGERRLSHLSRRHQRCSSMRATAAIFLRAARRRSRTLRARRANGSPATSATCWRTTRRRSLDYGYLTHFHDDHMGHPAPTSEDRARYKLTGITEVGELVPIKLMLDRGWPDYNYPAPLNDATVTNYRAFLEWQRKNNGMQVERLKPGRNDQIVLRRDAAKYPELRGPQHRRERRGLDRRRHQYACAPPADRRLEARGISHGEHVLDGDPRELRQVRLLQRRRHSRRAP